MSFLRRLNTIFLLGSLITPSVAKAIDKIDSPNVQKGELDLEYSGNHEFDDTRNKNDLADTEALVAYAPTDRWEVDLGGFFTKEAGQSLRADGVLFENFFQFAEKGANWVDTGVMIACNCALRSGLDTSLETKLLLEKDIGDFTNVLNLALAQAIGTEGQRGPNYGSEWSSSYAFNESFAAGIEIQSDLGQAGNTFKFRDGQTYVGPAVYGDLFDMFHYEVVYLEGVSQSASSSAVRFLFQYKKQF